MIKIVDDEFKNVEEIYKLNVDEAGWRVTPGGFHIKLGDSCEFGDFCKIGDDCEFGQGCKFENGCRIWDYSTFGEFCEFGEDCTLGLGCEFGDFCKLGDYCRIGDHSTFGDFCELDEDCVIGRDCVLGNHCKLGNDFRLEDGCVLGYNVTSMQLAEIFRNMWRKYGEKIIFTKWVTKDRKSPMFDGGHQLDYTVGKVICARGAKKSDQQCARGLHVFEYGHRPEWYGYCSANHTLIPIDVEVETKDILFGGLPFQRGKIRVRKLKVLS